MEAPRNCFSIGSIHSCYITILLGLEDEFGMNTNEKSIVLTLMYFGRKSGILWFQRLWPSEIEFIHQVGHIRTATVNNLVSYVDPEAE